MLNGKPFLGIVVVVGLLVSCSHSTSYVSGPDVPQAATVFNRSVPSPAVDFSGIQEGLAGGPIQVLVLGTAHLSGMKDLVPAEHLSLLLDKLAAFNPDIIAVEAQSGITCGVLKEYQAVFGELWENYCWDPTYVLDALNVTPAQALARAYELLDVDEVTITPGLRREMAAYFFASGWPNSAILQWLQLSQAERIADDGVNTRLLEWLDKRVNSSNESVSIAAKLGARLGLRYLHPMDDHTADIVYHGANEEMWEVIEAVWNQDSDAAIEFKHQQQQALGSPKGVLAFYQLLNSAVGQQIAIDEDFGAVAKLTEKNNMARRYVTRWQARGLRMAAHVVEASARNPSAKILVLVGSSHKPYFESYLNQMHDFEIVPVDSVLGSEQ